MHGRLPGKIEDIRKGLHQLFRQHGLKILMEGKSTTRVDFLDITLDLAKDKFLPYRKPNDVPLYIHVGSNHPPNVIHQVPRSIEKRLNSLASTE